MFNHKPGSRKLTPEQVLKIRELYVFEKWSQGRIAREFGMGPGQIGRIVRGEAWAGVEMMVREREVSEQEAMEAEKRAYTVFAGMIEGTKEFNERVLKEGANNTIGMDKFSLEKQKLLTERAKAYGARVNLDQLKSGDSHDDSRRTEGMDRGEGEGKG